MYQKRKEDINMKKLLICTLFVLVFSLTGCAEKGQANNTDQNNGQNQTTNNQENNMQSNTTNEGNQTAAVDISIKDWVEAVTIDGVKWTEFSEADVTEIFGNIEAGKNENGEAENTRTISFTDVNGKAYTGTIRHEETREDEIVLRYMTDNEAEDFTVHFELDKNNENAHKLDGIRIFRTEKAAMKDILVAWGIDKLDSKAFEMATNMENSEDAEYHFTCTTDYGRAKVSVNNELNDEGYREIEVEIEFEDVNVPYTIDLMEVYEGNNGENVKYFEIYLDR